MRSQLLSHVPYAQTEDHLCFVLDFVEGGNMYSDLMRGPYTHERAVFYAAQAPKSHPLIQLCLLLLRPA